MQSPQQTPQQSPQQSPSASPNRSRASSRGSHLTLDLSAIPPLTQPAEPTNTILITNLANPEIFYPEHISHLREIINSTAPVVYWSPLKSFRRIVCSFNNTEDAITVRQALDGEGIMGDRVRVYFGEHTPVRPVDQHLTAPESKKLFFISPPPSPPHGWEMKNEDPPNSVMLAEDLAHALARLSHDIKPMRTETKDEKGGTSPNFRRHRSSSSVVLFEPHHDQKEMPAISVDDYTDSGDENSPVTPAKSGFHSTQRPPIELMNHA